MLIWDAGETDWGHKVKEKHSFPNLSKSSIDKIDIISVEKSLLPNLIEFTRFVYGNKYDNFRFIDIYKLLLHKEPGVCVDIYEMNRAKTKFDKMMIAGEERVKLAAELIELLINQLGAKRTDTLYLWSARGYNRQVEKPSEYTVLHLPDITNNIIKIYDKDLDKDATLGKKFLDKINKTGFIHNLYGRRLWMADLKNGWPIEAMQWMIETNIEDIYEVIVYEVNKILEPWGGRSIYDKDKILINYGSKSNDKDFINGIEDHIFDSKYIKEINVPETNSNSRS